MVLDETLHIFALAPSKAGGNRIIYVPRRNKICTMPSEKTFSCSSQWMYLQHAQAPIKVPSMQKHSKMDLCQKEMALRLHLHLRWLCACMNQKAVAIGTRASAIPQTSHLEAYCTGVYCHHHPLQ